MRKSKNRQHGYMYRKGNISDQLSILTTALNQNLPMIEF